MSNGRSPYLPLKYVPLILALVAIYVIFFKTPNDPSQKTTTIHPSAPIHSSKPESAKKNY